MKNQVHVPIPVLRALRKVGQDIKDARLRRRVTIKLMAERASLSKATIGKVERGDPTVSMGAYSVVLFILGMVTRLGNIVDAMHDLTGRHLEDERLPQRVRLPRSANNKAAKSNNDINGDSNEQ